MQRALQWDGMIAAKMEANGSFAEMTPADLQVMKTFVATNRDQATPFEIVMSGETPADDPAAARAMLRSLELAGVTWWLESLWAIPETEEDVKAKQKRIQQGPARPDLPN
jgi:hypothetical protein